MRGLGIPLLRRRLSGWLRLRCGLSRRRGGLRIGRLSCGSRCCGLGRLGWRGGRSSGGWSAWSGRIRRCCAGLITRAWMLRNWNRMGARHAGAHLGRGHVGDVDQFDVEDEV